MHTCVFYCLFACVCVRACSHMTVLCVTVSECVCVCVCPLFLFASENDDHFFPCLYAGNQYILQVPTQEPSVMVELWVLFLEFLDYLQLGLVLLYAEGGSNGKYS